MPFTSCFEIVLQNAIIKAQLQSECRNEESHDRSRKGRHPTPFLGCGGRKRLRYGYDTHDGFTRAFGDHSGHRRRAFRVRATAFQAGLMTARVMPEHREAVQSLCQQYVALADAARIKTEKQPGGTRQAAMFRLAKFCHCGQICGHGRCAKNKTDEKIVKTKIIRLK